MPSTTPVALITGAAHRLGAQTARTLHERGWNLVIHYRTLRPAGGFEPVNWSGPAGQ